MSLAQFNARTARSRISSGCENTARLYRFPRRDDSPGWWQVPRALHRSRDLLVLIVAALAVAIVVTFL